MKTEQIIDALRDARGMTTDELMARMHCSRAAASSRLSRLYSYGKIWRVEYEYIHKDGRRLRYFQWRANKP